MQKFCLLIAGLFISSLICAQQEEQFTQFMFYKQGFNPGFAGSEAGTAISGLYRSQWVGLEGAPETQLLTFSSRVANRIGIGANVLRQTIGITSYYTFDGVYSYKITPLGKGELYAGIQGSMRLLRVDYNQLKGTQPITIDQAIPAGIQSKIVPNAGFGLYYAGQHFYAGLSAPRLINNNIDLADSGDIISLESRHLFFMLGYYWSIGEAVLIPQGLAKYVAGAPVDLDVNVTLKFKSRFSIGASYRLGGNLPESTGESASLMVGIPLGKSMLLGLAYEATLTDLRTYNSGSMEGVIRYIFGGGEDVSGGPELEDPIFF